MTAEQPRHPARQARMGLLVAGLLFLVVVVGGANLLATYLEFHSLTASQARAGQLVERKLCTSFTRLAALEPPKGMASTNPSRAFAQQEHSILVGLGPDIGCPPPGR